jgi:hypothetical protein
MNVGLPSFSFEGSGGIVGAVTGLFDVCRLSKAKKTIRFKIKDKRAGKEFQQDKRSVLYKDKFRTVAECIATSFKSK